MSIGDTSIFQNAGSNKNLDLAGDGTNGKKVIFKDHNLLADVSNGGNGQICITTCINRLGKSQYVQIDKVKNTIRVKNDHPVLCQ